MSSLRDEMHKRLMEWVNTNAAQDDFAVRAYVEVADLEETVDAQVAYLLAAVRAALLAPEAVEAGARRLHLGEHLFVGEWEVPHQMFEGRIISDDDKDGYRYSSKGVLTAALDAAFGTEGSDDDH